MWNFFSRKDEIEQPLYKTDIHSHLLPGLDDGVKTFEDAETIIRMFMESGFTRAITTPHIMNDYYRNTPSGISEKAIELRNYLKEKNIVFDLQFDAEYYFDETLQELLASDAKMLTFHDNYLLFETKKKLRLINRYVFFLSVLINLILKFFDLCNDHHETK